MSPRRIPPVVMLFTGMIMLGGFSAIAADPPPPPPRPSLPVSIPDPEWEGPFVVIPDCDDTPPLFIDDEPGCYFLFRPPKIIGGSEALYGYIERHNLYPDAAAAAELQGDVIVEYTVGLDSLAHDVTCLAERPERWGFGEAAVQAIEAMRFLPAEPRKGELAEFTMRMGLCFRPEMILDN